MLFILFGVGRFAVNWTTGVWQINPIYIRLFSASAVANPYGPRRAMGPMTLAPS